VGARAAVATYRQFGLAAYLQDEAMWLHGRRIAASSVRAIGECAVVASSFLLQFPAKCVAVPSRDLEDAFRVRLEAQHGWQFDHSWPTEPERSFRQVRASRRPGDGAPDRRQLRAVDHRGRDPGEARRRAAYAAARCALPPSRWRAPPAASCR
jgi:hypothetical protein